MMQTFRKTRQSNFELLRIICMLMVVAHHSVLYSGVQDAYDLAHPTLNLFFCQIWGMWGKTAINVFVLISGYFMCKQELRMGRFLKLLGQVKLYDISIFIVCVLIGYDVLSVSRAFYILFQNVRQINHAFTGSFLVIYLLIPFNNILIANMNRLQHTALVALGLGVFMVGGTFMGNPGVFNHVSWYVVLYYVGAHIRLYPYRWMSRSNIISIALAGTISLCLLNVLVVDCVSAYSGKIFGKMAAYYLVHDSNKFGAFSVALFLFLLFKNIPLRTLPIVNRLASATFGVLLIHDASPGIRKLLWVDLFRLADFFQSSSVCGRFLVATVVVYLACSIVDLTRQFGRDMLLRCLGSFNWQRTN